MVTQSRLRELFNYDSRTGVFSRIINARGMRNKVGSLHNGGYLQICVDYKTYLAHRLAWLYVYGELCVHIDHINGDKLDNRISNLRLATNKQNSENIKLYSNNKSSARGVHFCNRSQKWIARVVHYQRVHYIGSFDSVEEASRAAKTKRDELFTHHKTSHSA